MWFKKKKKFICGHMTHLVSPDGSESAEGILQQQLDSLFSLECGQIYIFLHCI